MIDAKKKVFCELTKSPHPPRSADLVKAVVLVFGRYFRFFGNGRVYGGLSNRQTKVLTQGGGFGKKVGLRGWGRQVGF